MNNVFIVIIYMYSIVDNLEEELDTLEQKFYLLIEQYKKYYVLYKNPNNKDRKEYKNIFLNSKSNISNVQRDLFLLENKIHTQIDALHNKFEKQNIKIEKDKIYLNKLKKINDKLKNITNASFPFRKQMNLNKTQNKVYLLYHGVGILAILYLIALTYRT